MTGAVPMSVMSLYSDTVFVVRPILIIVIYITHFLQILHRTIGSLYAECAVLRSLGPLY